MVLNVSSLRIDTQSLSHLSIGEFFQMAKPLMIFIIAMSLYAVFVYKFYKFLARRDIFNLRKKYDADELSRLMSSIFYFLENLVLTPLIVFFWFIVLSALLLLLAKNQNPNTILLSASAIVATVRITAYYSENLSQDLAKMIPFALLGVFLIDVSYFSIDATLETVKQVPSLLRVLVYYLGFVISLEFVMRILHGFATLAMGNKNN